MDGAGAARLTEEAAAVLKARDEFTLWLRGPSSYLAAIERHEIPVGRTVTLHGRTIEATPDGFVVDGEVSGPRTIEAGRYRLRLSHQNMPAAVVLDGDVPRDDVTPEWFPYDPAFRFEVVLERDPADLKIGSTREQKRSATRAGWFRFDVGGATCRLMALRLNEPGVAPDQLDVYFSDATSGVETYRMRYLGVEGFPEGGYVLDFNRAYNPACVYSAYYNCPIPPLENELAIAIRAGEKLPRRRARPASSRSPSSH